MSLAEELKDLTDRLEKILHEELPEVAHDAVEGLHDMDYAQDQPSYKRLATVVAELDKVQRALGLRTFELLRRPPEEGPGPVLARLSYTPGPSPAAPPGAPPPSAPTEPLVKCSYLNCPSSDVSTCFDCSKPFCSAHVDPAVHPCGDLLA